jgi:8-oxo-dGTP pyrophosphatase MutT (NUDIX family)
MTNRATTDDLDALLKEARWSLRDFRNIILSCIGGSALAVTWGLRVKGRAWEKVALLAVAAKVRPSPDPLVALRDPGIALPATVSMLENIAKHSDDSIVAEQVLAGWDDGAAILVMLRNLGLISITPIAGTVAVRAVSSVAADFLLSMGLHLEERAPFVGAFGDVERNVEERRRLRELIRHMEQNRVDLAKSKGRSPRVGRDVESALIIIKAEFSGEECILMQWSESWGRRTGDGRATADSGYYWFIGGMMEPADGGSLLRCAAREVGEEVGIDPADVQLFAQALFTHTDVRVSRRVGLYSKLVYHIFGATLRLSPAVSQIIQLKWTRELSVHTPHGVGTIPRQMRWRTWQEIKADPLLRKDAGGIVDELEKHLSEVPLQPRP